MNYNLLFGWLAFIALFLRTSKNAAMTTENGYEQIRPSKTLAFIIFLPIIGFVCLSTWEYWGDYFNYIQDYSVFPTNIDSAFAYIRAQDNSWLFYGLTWMIKVISGGNVIAYRIVLALIQSLPFIYLYRKYSVSYVFSIYLFVVTAIPLAWMLNGIRQFTAASIIYAATPLMEEKKYLRVSLTIVLASLFHQTAILMLPIVFIAQGESWNWKTNLAIVAAIVLAIVISSRTGTYESLMEVAGYDVSYFRGDDGTHPVRVLVSFVPVFLAFWGRKKMENDDIPIINICINMSIISFGIYVIAMVTSGILVGRVPLYTSLYNFILLPYLIKRLFTKRMAKTMSFLAVVFYFLYYYIQYVR